MSNGAPAAISAERSEPPTYENKITYQKCSACFFHIFGPKPIANSFTFTLQIFATIKCPASWISIKNPNKNIIFKADIIIVIKFYPPYF